MHRVNGADSGCMSERTATWVGIPRTSGKPSSKFVILEGWQQAAKFVVWFAVVLCLTKGARLLNRIVLLKRDVSRRHIRVSAPARFGLAVEMEVVVGG